MFSKCKESIANDYSASSTYFVTTSWYDMADAIDQSQIIVISDLPLDMLSYALHSIYGYSWWDNDHSYNQSWTPTLNFDKYDFNLTDSEIKSSKHNPWQNLSYQLNRIEENNHTYNSSTNTDKIVLIFTDFSDDQHEPVINYADSEDYSSVVNELVNTRNAHNKKVLKEERAMKASQKLDDIIQTINNMKQKDKEKVLKELLK